MGQKQAVERVVAANLQDGSEPGAELMMVGFCTIKISRVRDINAELQR